MTENKKTAPIRMIDDLGRIVLPVEARAALDWDNGTPVEIWVNATNNEVIIRQHMFCCTYCGATNNLKKYQKKHICSFCQKEIASLQE